MGAPRLFDKKRIHTELATDRQRQIEEGKQLADAIQALRETKQLEEASLERFRRETVRKVQIEIDTLIQQRDALRKEPTTS